MDELVYEYHNIQDTKLPFIFHKNMMVKNHSIITNWHTNIEFLYFTEGSGQVICDREYYDVSAGDLFIVNANSLHNIISKDLVYHCLIVDYEFCFSNDIDTDNLIFQNKVSDINANVKFERIVSEFSTKSDFFTLGIRSATLEFLLYLCRNYICENPKLKEKINVKTIENMKIAIGYIKSHFNQQITIDDLAHETGLSKYYFVREFKKYTGNTPISFINIIRCDYAKKILLSKKHTIGEVCNMSGFNNLSYFSEVYKKYIGTLPSGRI